MRQLANRDGRNFGKIARPVHLNLVEAAHRDIGEHAIRIAHNVDMVGDRARVEGLQKREWRLRIEDLDLAGVFQREPDLRTVRRGRNVGAEGAGLLDLRSCGRRR
jgi:hypothetical protein